MNDMTCNCHEYCARFHFKFLNYNLSWLRWNYNIYYIWDKINGIVKTSKLYLSKEREKERETIYNVIASFQTRVAFQENRLDLKHHTSRFSQTIFLFHSLNWINMFSNNHLACVASKHFDSRKKNYSNLNVRAQWM